MIALRARKGGNMKLFKICYSAVKDTGEYIKLFDYVIAEDRDEAILFFKIHELIRNEKRDCKVLLSSILRVERIGN